MLIVVVGGEYIGVSANTQRNYGLQHGVQIAEVEYCLLLTCVTCNFNPPILNINSLDTRLRILTVYSAFESIIQILN